MKNPLNIFATELARLGASFRAFAERALSLAPAYVFTDCPSSSTGRYHNTDELGPDGTVLHTKRVFAVADALVTALGIGHYRDLVLTAVLLHDACKQGLYRSGRTVNTHPAIAANLTSFVAGYYPGIINGRAAALLADCVGFHYGPWGTGDYAINSLADLSVPALVVHAADYIASRKGVYVNV